MSRMAERQLQVATFDALDIVRRAQVHGQDRSDEVALRSAIDKLVNATIDSYEQMAVRYTALHGDKPSIADRRHLKVLLNEVRRRVRLGQVKVTGRRWRLLDVGAGPGRDLTFLVSTTDDLDAVAVEMCPTFLKMLRGAENRGRVLSPPYELDMRRLTGIPAASYACVRHHATLHHLPLLWRGMGADEAVAESYRVVQPGGILYTLVKRGNGMRIVDTNEGLGSRLFQLYTPEMINELLIRNGFRVIRLDLCWEWQRNVDWLRVLAERPG